ncbi:TPA: Wzz/FepE/Etk N-terminal domain-containing protein [Photobacterium damselae]|uniref:Wzz/FepE/Etk N-terminal domain-containing protein n=1 Tax=Photobacterium damselae TaxID=38293 RepID=UPI00311B197C
MSDVQMANNTSNDVNDLIELAKTLWKGKVTIVVCSLIFTVCAIIYALTAQQWWISKALITAGQYQNTTNIRSQVTNLYAVIDDSSRINSILDSKRLLDDYITEFNAFDNKKTFIENNEIMKQYADKAKLTDENKAQFMVSWAKRISVSQPDKKNKPNIYQISFEATSSKLAHDLLVAYSKYISNIVRNELIDTLDAKVSYSKQILQANKLALEASAKRQLASELVKTNYALDMAKSADVTKPLADMSNELFQIQLGSEALAEKIKVLDKIKDLSLFEPKLGVIHSKLELLSQIKLDRNITLQSVRYLKNIDYPISRDKPNRSIIVMLSLFIGIILGMVVVMFNHEYNKWHL